MTQPGLLPEQFDLLEVVIRAYEAHLPDRTSFRIGRYVTGVRLTHPGLSVNDVDIHEGDLLELAEAGLVRRVSDTQFDLTAQGLNVKNSPAPMTDAGDPVGRPMPSESARTKSSTAVHWVLVASPSDVEAERAATVEAVERWNASHWREMHAVLVASRWEIAATPAQGEPQSLIDRQLVDDADIVVAIFWSRLGGGGNDKTSGTVHEINLCINRGKQVLLYFCDRDVPKNILDPEQYAALEKYQKSIRNSSLYRTFETPDQLQTLLLQDLTAAVANLAERGSSNSPGERLVADPNDALPWEDRPGAPMFSISPGLENRKKDVTLGATLRIRSEPMVGALKLSAGINEEAMLQTHLMLQNSRDPNETKHQAKPIPLTL